MQKNKLKDVWQKKRKTKEVSGRASKHFGRTDVQGKELENRRLKKNKSKTELQRNKRCFLKEFEKGQLQKKKGKR